MLMRQPCDYPAGICTGSTSLDCWIAHLHTQKILLYERWTWASSCQGFGSPAPLEWLHCHPIGDGNQLLSSSSLMLYEGLWLQLRPSSCSQLCWYIRLDGQQLESELRVGHQAAGQQHSTSGSPLRSPS